MRNYRKVLLDPADCTLLIVDHQPQMYFGVEGSQRSTILNAIKGLAKTASSFQVPTILTTVTAESFAGPLSKDVLSVFPGTRPIDRTTLNAWEDACVKRAVADTGRKKIIIAGLWTEVCVAFPALAAQAEGYEVYVVVDACGGASDDAHKAALQRMIQHGITPITWQSLLLEFQRDWADKTTYDKVNAIIDECGGVYGVGLAYAKFMKPMTSG
ncbi:MAG: hydrolase [Christensenellaceae bacterium]|jgi:nicotinamidase-related amidase|nr:hydrolase [Christensenellaceae bacterium]